MSCYIQRTCADKIPGLGGRTAHVLKMREGRPRHVLNLRAFFLLLLKDPDTQMACNTPNYWPHFGSQNIRRLFSSLLFYSTLLNDIVVRRA